MLRDSDHKIENQETVFHKSKARAMTRPPYFDILPGDGRKAKMRLRVVKGKVECICFRQSGKKYLGLKGRWHSFRLWELRKYHLHNKALWTWLELYHITPQSTYYRRSSDAPDQPKMTKGTRDFLAMLPPAPPSLYPKVELPRQTFQATIEIRTECLQRVDSNQVNAWIRKHFEDCDLGTITVAVTETGEANQPAFGTSDKE